VSRDGCTVCTTQILYKDSEHADSTTTTTTTAAAEADAATNVDDGGAFTPLANLIFTKF